MARNKTENENNKLFEDISFFKLEFVSLAILKHTFMK